jgi:hypothetical protein
MTEFIKTVCHVDTPVCLLYDGVPVPEHSVNIPPGTVYNSVADVPRAVSEELRSWGKYNPTTNSLDYSDFMPDDLKHVRDLFDKEFSHG